MVPRELIYPPGQYARSRSRSSNAKDFQASQTARRPPRCASSATRSQVVVERGDRRTARRPGQLKAGDVITAVDGAQVTVRDEAHRAGPGQAGRHRADRRATPATARQRTATVTSRRPPGRHARASGSVIDQRQPHPFTLKIDLDDIGGPSAGLMFTLGIIDKLKPEDLTGGKVIAGTGTIDDEGNVGPIGGIPQKLVGAKKRRGQGVPGPGGQLRGGASRNAAAGPADGQGRHRWTRRSTALRARSRGGSARPTRAPYVR